MCAFGVLWLSCEAPAATAAGVSHDNPRAQTCTCQGPGLQKQHQNSTSRPPRERRKNEISGGREKKTAKYWTLAKIGQTKLAKFGQIRFGQMRSRPFPLLLDVGLILRCDPHWTALSAIAWSGRPPVSPWFTPLCQHWQLVLVRILVSTGVVHPQPMLHDPFPGGRSARHKHLPLGCPASGNFFHCLCVCPAFDDLRALWCQRSGVPVQSAPEWCRHPWLFDTSSNLNSSRSIRPHVRFVWEASERFLRLFS